MTLPSPNLDNLQFQSDLVDEARKRIIQYCPEWTDYNVSDPGITLIELFAWMTELMVYRLNRVPEKNYVKFLEMLGLQRKPSSCAQTDLTFWLSIPLPISPENMQDVVIPQALEVRSSTGEEPESIFSTDRQLRITPPVLTQLHKDKDVRRNYLPRLGIETFYPFDQYNPRQGDTFYIGFDSSKDLSGHIIQFNFVCEPSEAVGVRRDDPPWIWECSLGNNEWQVVPLSTFQDEKDTTGGFNNSEGSLTIYFPLDWHTELVHGREAYWVRCRLYQRIPSQGMYAESPKIVSLVASTLGATVPASHAQVVRQESLGRSSGEAGQEFLLQNAPILELREGETLQVEEYRNGEYVYVPWQRVEDFASSSRYDRHFTLDSASGRIQLGPSVRQPDGAVKQYGRVPDHDRGLVFTQYRFGGGAKGNLPPNMLRTMTSTIAYVSRVTNLKRASGGQDQETLEEVKLRAQRELQAQKRAVTAQDYETLTMNFSRSVARVKSITPQLDSKELGAVQIMIVPAVQAALEEGDVSRLALGDEFVKGLIRYLDKYRLLTTHVRIREPNYLGVKVKTRIVIDDYSSPEIVIPRVNQHLRNFLNPLVPFPDREEAEHMLEKGWIGWELGKGLFAAEIYAFIQRMPGIKYVLDVEISSRPVIPRNEGVQGLAVAPLTVLEDKVLWVPENTLLCSLDHEIITVDLAELGQGRKP